MLPRSFHYLCSLCSKSKTSPQVNQLLVIKRCASIEASANPDDPEASENKLSKAMKAYLERARAYNEFIQKEEDKFKIGKRHLANMMGWDPETLTQEKINEGIQYLFPSGLFVPGARPSMKAPSLVFPPRKEAQFDETGRPHHYLFYTGRPLFYSLLHEMVAKFEMLENEENELLAKGVEITPKPLDMIGSQWLTKEQLEKRLVEKINDTEYTNFVNSMERLANHKLANKASDFLLGYRSMLAATSMNFTETIEPSTDADGRQYVTVTECPRKSARADVTVFSPGTGKISINGQDIEYFKTTQARSQILFPLELTGLLNSVNVVASVSGGGETGQAGAIRWGISWALRSFVPPSVIDTMRLAGLLTRDFRKKERKKPGQEGARRKFTWKKR